MSGLILSLGLLGFIGGVIAVVTLLSQRDANREKEKAAGKKDGVQSSSASPPTNGSDSGSRAGRPGGNGGAHRT